MIYYSSEHIQDLNLTSLAEEVYKSLQEENNMFPNSLHSEKQVIEIPMNDCPSSISV